MRATALCIIPRGRANAMRSRRVVCCLPLCTASAGVGGRRAEARALQGFCPKQFKVFYVFCCRTRSWARRARASGCWLRRRAASLHRRSAPPPSPRTNRTRRVPHPVLIGHAASLTVRCPVLLPFSLKLSTFPAEAPPLPSPAPPADPTTEAPFTRAPPSTAASSPCGACGGGGRAGAEARLIAGTAPAALGRQRAPRVGGGGAHGCGAAGRGSVRAGAAPPRDGGRGCRQPRDDRVPARPARAGPPPPPSY